MPTLTSAIRDAVEHLPSAAVLTVDNVTWNEYEQLSQELSDRPSLRITYDRGRLDLVTTSRGHDYRLVIIERMVWILAEELDIEVEGVGRTTQKRKRALKGTEPDTSFYVGNIERTVGKEELNLETDPPPDIVVEIDKSNQSLQKFPIYATFGVPEIWRHLVRRRKAEIYQLIENTYVEVPASRFFPILTNSALTRFIEQAAAEGQTAAIKAFRQWVKSRK